MDTHIELSAQPHPDPRIRRVGFDLTAPYVEQCWGAIVGPSGVAVLRRLPTLWATQEPARLPTAQFAQSLGLGNGTGHHGRLQRALERLTQYRLADWVDEGQRVAVYSSVAPLEPHQLARVPEWTRHAHHELLAEHLDQVAALDRPGSKVASIAERLNCLEQPTDPQQSSNIGLEL